MRLFVAVEIPAAIRDCLGEFLEELRASAAQAADKRPRWVRADNLHVTLKFIGESPPEKQDGIRAALSKVRSNLPLQIAFRGLGFFPNDKRPKVFWAALQASENLVPLATDVDTALATQAIPRETRAFAPHLTLARFEPPGLSEKLRGVIQQNMDREFGSFATNEFHLIQSKTKPSGAEYTPLATFSFTTEHPR